MVKLCYFTRSKGENIHYLLSKEVGSDVYAIIAYFLDYILSRKSLPDK